MSNFQLGILVGFFLGVLVMFVVLGIINLYIEDRWKKNALARERAAREIHDHR